MTTPEDPMEAMLRVSGTVQGVGYRPFVLQTAQRLGLRGWVKNDVRGVLLRVAGSEDAVEALMTELARGAPPAARVDGVERVAVEGAEPGAGFAIVASGDDGEEAATAVPPELALCAACREELLEASDRRHRYPFINCTQCGPRYSIVEALPYDREATTMRAFPMCRECRAEYDDPCDRRFHAQPNACPACGPQLELTDAAGATVARRDEALRRTQEALRTGRIVAVKGLGGFHLMCDAANEAAVRELRRRKHREEKPFAVMVRDVAALREVAEVPPAAERWLTAPAAPIVLLRRRADANLADAVAPGNPWVGAMLASTPLHVLLLADLRHPVVATSANLAEEPLCTDDAEARTRLHGIAELFLGHDRPIARPVDDSVLRLTAAGAPVRLRRARGQAPVPLRLPGAVTAPMLCLGAQMKNTVALAHGDRVTLSPHIGDLGNAATQAVFARTVELLTSLHRTRPAVVVHDKHPDYASTRHAERLGLPRVAVQHHLAHVLACLLEHGQAADGVLGVCWDGTGWGEDGTVWGGEFLRLERGTATRFGRLRRFRLAGGDAAVRDGRRSALGLAHELGRAEFEAMARRLHLAASEAELLEVMLARGLNSPLCSSAGRLFDAFGALLGVGGRNSFEGQVPVALESAACTATGADGDVLEFPVTEATDGASVELDWGPALAQGAASGGSTAERALAFHRGLAEGIAAVARRAEAGTVALTGGCFQNVLLRELTETALERDGFRVIAPRELPPNDGAIAAGQALGAWWQLTTVQPG